MLVFLRGAGTPALLISAIVHAAALLAMAFYKFNILPAPEVVSLETIVAEEREAPQFEQELSLDTTVSENLNVQAGGMVTTAIGSAATEPLQRSKVEQSEALQDADFQVVSIDDINVTGIQELGGDLGHGEFSGEVGARVEGYGAAMHRLTLELLRMMRSQPVLVVWLFDASISLEDDREEIANNFEKVYQELEIAQSEKNARKTKYAPVETMIVSYGEATRKMFPEPTSDLDKIQNAIKSMPIDESGVESTYTSLAKAMDEYGPGTLRSKRKLVLVVVTDENGDDEQLLEEVIDRSKRYRAPVYMLSREAMFGSGRLVMEWVDPETSLKYWVTVQRGPETAFAECLQYDGMHERWDATSSGFGPYGHSRLAKLSGGIAFMLSGSEERLVGDSGWWGPRRYEDFAMKEYEPRLLSRRDYELSRNKSDFRRTIAEVIQALNPNDDEQLKLQVHHYSMDPAQFLRQRERQFGRTLRTLTILNEAIRRLDEIKPMRAEEREPRWRAAFDLMYAQLLSYRVRQFQFLLALDNHGREMPKPSDPKSNEWFIRNTPTLIEPTEAQIKATKVDMEEIESQRQLALHLYEQVVEVHPGTPWAQRAQMEMGWGFGWEFYDTFWDPRQYDSSKAPKF